MLKIALSSDDKGAIGDAYLSMANSYFRLNYDSTVFFLHRAIPNFMATQNRSKEAIVLSLMARSQWNLNQYDSAVINNLKALKIYQELQDTLNQAVCNQRIGGSWLAIDTYDSAAVYYYKAKELFVMLDDKFGMIANAIELGVLQKRIGNYDQAKSSYKNALEIARLQKDSNHMIYANNNLGQLYLELHDLDTAIYYTERSLSLMPKVSHPYQIGIVMSNLAHLYAEKNQLERGLDLCIEAEHYFLLSENKSGLDNLYLTRAGIYRGLGDLENALKYCHLSEKTSLETESRGTLLSCYTEYKNIYKQLGDFQQALFYTELHDSLKSQLLETDLKKKIEELELKYTKAETEKQLSLMTIKAHEDKITIQKSNLQKWVLGSLLSTIAIITGLLFWQVGVKRKHNRELSLKNLQINESLKENKDLMKEIHHRVKNNLQIISSLLDIQSREINDPIAASVLQQSVSRVNSIAKIHQSLYSNQAAKINLKNYLEDLVFTLQDMYGAEDDKIEFVLPSSSKEMARDDIIYLGMILNEVVSNAFKHALVHVDQALLTIKIQEVSDFLEISVKDNGPGFILEKQPTQFKSLGMELIDLFAKKIKGTYSWSNDKGTLFKLKIPIKH